MLQKSLHNIKVSVKLTTQIPVRHKVYIKDVSIQDLDLVDDHYFLQLQRKNKSQQLTIRLLINKDII